MIFTYAAEGIIFLDNERIDAESVSSVTSYASILSFNQFLEKNYDVAMKSINAHEAGGIGGYSYDLKKGTSFGIINSMINYYRINGYLSLSVWYDSAPAVNAPPRMGKDRIMDQYEIYLSMNGYELKDGAVQKKATNFIDDARMFFGKIGEAIGKFFELLTFSIKDHYGANIIPAPVMWVINIFFLPLWIILVIEALPIVVAIVHAIGALLDSVTPLT